MDERKAAVIQWWFGRTGAGSVLTTELDLLAGVRLPLPDLLQTLEDCWSRAVAHGRTPLSLAYFWRAVQDAENQSFKQHRESTHGHELGHTGAAILDWLNERAAFYRSRM